MHQSGYTADDSSQFTAIVEPTHFHEIVTLMFFQKSNDLVCPTFG